MMLIPAWTTFFFFCCNMTVCGTMGLQTWNPIGDLGKNPGTGDVKFRISFRVLAYGR